MAKVSPGEIFDGWTFVDNHINIPIEALPGLTAAEADPTTGNAMEVLRQILEQTHLRITGLAPGNRPTKAAITKQNPAIATGTGIEPGTLRQNYQATFDLKPVALELASEG